MKKKSLTITLDDKTVEINKLPIGEYVELLGALQELPKHISNFDTLNPQDLLSKLPTIVAQSLPEVLNVLHIATKLELEYLKTLGLHEIVDLFIGVVEVNKYDYLFSKVKKGLATMQVAQTPTLSEST